MPTYSFYIYNTEVLAYNSGTGAFDFSADYSHPKGLYKVEVRDLDLTMDTSFDLDQSAQVTTLDGDLIASGNILTPNYALVRDPKDGSDIYLDRIEVNGQHLGYFSDVELRPGESYAVAESSTAAMAHSYFETSGVACFGPGTLVSTPGGERAIESLSVGETILTLDHGPQPIRWIGRAAVSHAEIASDPDLLPLTVPPGTFGSAPTRELVLSANHRVLVRAPQLELWFGQPEVLVKTEFLSGIERSPTPPQSIVYTHLLFERHELIKANGLWVESFFAGPQSLKSLPTPLRRQVARLAAGITETARPCLGRRDAALLDDRSWLVRAA